MDKADKNYKESLIFRYEDIFFSYYLNNERICRDMIKDHTLVYVYSGELIMLEGKSKIKIHGGECVFLRKDNRVNMVKQPRGEEQFSGIFMKFSRAFLREFYQMINKSKIPQTVQKHKPSVIKLPHTPAITSLFQSMLPYFDTTVKPLDEVMKLKMLEGIYALLDMDENFYASLFDFTEPWKIDIFDFMEKNYMFDLSVEDIAHYTGRSLATFKRDFRKISGLSPQKWLIEKRLKTAKDKLENDKKKVSDVYLEVGFKNFSHFSTAFKKQFGYPPSNNQCEPSSKII